MKDGWHTVKGFIVYVEDGYVIRGLTDDELRTTYCYRYNKKLRCLVATGRITVDAFRAGVRRGTVTMS